MNIHHIGIIVDSLEKNITIFLKLGYTLLSESMIDNIQHNKIVFLRSSDNIQMIELIEPLGENSSVYGFPKNYHHICYDVSDYPDFINFFKSLKIGKIFTEPIIAPALTNRKVIFACLNNGMFVEFIISK